MRRYGILLLALLLVDCNGDGSSSTQSTQVLPGTYRGPASFTVTIGSTSRGTNTQIVIVVSSGGTVTVGQFPPTQLRGNQFTATLPFTAFNQPGSGLNCTQGTFNVDGTFAGTTVSGPISSSGLVCNGFALVFSGTYSATLQATELRRDARDADLFETARDAILGLVPAK